MTTVNLPLNKTINHTQPDNDSSDEISMTARGREIKQILQQMLNSIEVYRS